MGSSRRISRWIGLYTFSTESSRRIALQDCYLNLRKALCDVLMALSVFFDCLGFLIHASVFLHLPCAPVCRFVA